MPSEVTHHGAIIDAIGKSGLIAELIERHDGQFKYELIYKYDANRN